MKSMHLSRASVNPFRCVSLGQQAHREALVALAIVLLVALLASYAPSRRVRRVDPTVALRVE